MGKLMLNGRNYSGLVDAQGIFIDTENVIVPQTTYSGTGSYTASQDCCVSIDIANETNDLGRIYLNGEIVYQQYNSVVSQLKQFIFAKKGDVVSWESSFTQGTQTYTVYGIQMGSQVTFLSEYASACYDTTEREVGCWVDGKPLYKRTWDFSASPIMLPYNDWVDTGISASANIEKIISAESQYGSLTNMGIEIGTGAGGFVVGVNKYDNTGNTRGLAYLTLLYTKTTDVAGSGNWTPTAMPTVHFDGNEKVVGTWFGDTLYEATIQTAIPNNAQVNYPHGISGIDKIVSIEGGAWDGSQYLPINMTGYVSGNNEGALRVTATKTNISVLPLSWDGSSYTGYWTIRYTKA